MNVSIHRQFPVLTHLSIMTLHINTFHMTGYFSGKFICHWWIPFTKSWQRNNFIFFISLNKLSKNPTQIASNLTAETLSHSSDITVMTNNMFLISISVKPQTVFSAHFWWYTAWPGNYSPKSNPAVNMGLNPVTPTHSERWSLQLWQPTVMPLTTRFFFIVTSLTWLHLCTTLKNLGE